MSETSERDAVLAEFEYDAINHRRLWGIAAMADEIVRQRQRADRAERILAALREPSEKLLGEVDRQLFAQPSVKGVFFSRAIRAAVAAAEREVGA